MSDERLFATGGLMGLVICLSFYLGGLALGFIPWGPFALVMTGLLGLGGGAGSVLTWVLRWDQRSPRSILIWGSVVTPLSAVGGFILAVVVSALTEASAGWSYFPIFIGAAVLTNYAVGAWTLKNYDGF